MKLRYLVPVLLLSVLLIVPATGCQTDYNAIEIVPDGVSLIASIQVSELIDDQDIRDAFAKYEKEPDQPQTVEEAIDELVEESGIDVSDFSEVILFGDVSDTEQSDYMGFVAEGTFDENQFVNNIEENTGEELTESDYKGFKLYTNDDEDFSIAFLNDKMLLGGSTRAVKDSINVIEGVRQPISGQLLDTHNRYDDTLVSLAFELPEEAKESFAGESDMDDMPISMDAFSDIDTVGFALGKETTLFTVTIEFHSLSTDSLQDMFDTIDGLISLFKGMIEEPDMKELLGDIEVSISESWMTITFDLDLSEIDEMMETLEL